MGFVLFVVCCLVGLGFGFVKQKEDTCKMPLHIKKKNLEQHESSRMQVGHPLWALERKVRGKQQVKNQTPPVTSMTDCGHALVTLSFSRSWRRDPNL